MVKINVHADCGNSPKNIFLKDLSVAFGKGNISYIIEQVSDDIEWHIIGDKRIQGKADFVAEWEQMQTQKAVEVTIATVISHGKFGSVNGEIITQDGKTYAYCDVYEFTNVKGTSIKSITSYVIETTETV
jgi:hypothetical protein